MDILFERYMSQTDSANFLYLVTFPSKTSISNFLRAYNDINF
jgi:hypothetical protein